MNGEVWINGINLSGLWFKKPVKAYWEDALGCWYDASGNFNADNLGIEYKNSCVTFASYSKKEAELWTQGVLATLKLIREWGTVG